jgi:hypothetical protein
MLGVISGNATYRYGKVISIVSFGFSGCPAGRWGW